MHSEVPVQGKQDLTLNDPVQESLISRPVGLSNSVEQSDLCCTSTAGLDVRLPKRFGN
jgi:hypothetical protein